MHDQVIIGIDREHTPMVMRNEYLLCRPAYGHKAPPCMYPGLNCKHCTKEVQSHLVYSYNTRACVGAEIEEVAIDWSCIPKHEVGTVAKQFSNKSSPTANFNDVNCNVVQ